jgi:hypothetical protein
MAFVTFRGTTPTLELTATDWHLQLTHPSIADTLVLTAFPRDGEPYRRSIEGWARSDGRSLSDGIRITGGQANLTQAWDCSFLVKRPQFELFNQLLQAQQGVTPVTILDRFAGETDNALCWLDVDQQYLTPALLGSWWLLQFRAIEEV